VYGEGLARLGPGWLRAIGGAACQRGPGCVSIQSGVLCCLGARGAFIALHVGRFKCGGVSRGDGGAPVRVCGSVGFSVTLDPARSGPSGLGPGEAPCPVVRVKQRSPPLAAAGVVLFGSLGGGSLTWLSACGSLVWWGLGGCRVACVVLGSFRCEGLFFVGVCGVCHEIASFT
jgi:hypothetical protein